MKKIIVLLSILIILTGCSGSKQEAEPKTDEPATTDVDALSADDLYHLGLDLNSHSQGFSLKHTCLL